MQSPYPEARKRQYSHMTAAELAAEMDRIDTMYAAFDERIAEALRPEPVDWQRHYTELFADLTAIAHRVHATDGGA